MTLTARQRTKINAALCLLHDHGHDANSVIQMANRFMQDGVDTRSAYERSLNSYLGQQPDILPVISKVLRLVDASDDGTVDRYDAALSEYVTTGDDSSINALAPVIAQGSLALAVQSGEITQEEADSGALEKALGFEPGPALQSALEATTGQESEQQAAKPPEQWQQSPREAPEIGDPPVMNATNSSQISLGGPTGFVGPGTRAKWARETGPPNAGNVDAAQGA